MKEDGKDLINGTGTRKDGWALDVDQRLQNPTRASGSGGGGGRLVWLRGHRCEEPDLRCPAKIRGERYFMMRKRQNTPLLRSGTDTYMLQVIYEKAL